MSLPLKQRFKNQTTYKNDASVAFAQHFIKTDDIVRFIKIPLAELF